MGLMANPYRYMSNDASTFFERVCKALDNRETYHEFLKVVNLFVQDYIDTARLIKESRNFLGDTELLRQFKDILGWDEQKEREHWMKEHLAGIGAANTAPNAEGQVVLDKNDAAANPGATGGWARPVVVKGIVREKLSGREMTMKYGSYRKLPANVRAFFPFFVSLEQQIFC